MSTQGVDFSSPIVQSPEEGHAAIKGVDTEYVIEKIAGTIARSFPGAEMIFPVSRRAAFSTLGGRRGSIAVQEEFDHGKAYNGRFPLGRVGNGMLDLLIRDLHDQILRIGDQIIQKGGGINFTILVQGRHRNTDSISGRHGWDREIHRHTVICVSGPYESDNSP